jgi:hypothetical protein
MAASAFRRRRFMFLAAVVGGAETIGRRRRLSRVRHALGRLGGAPTTHLVNPIALSPQRLIDRSGPHKRRRTALALFDPSA